MSTLHTLKESWYSDTALYEQCAFASKGDALVLLQDAVLSLQSSMSFSSFLAKCSAMDVMVYAVADDVERRGVQNAYPEVQLIGFDELVDLTLEYDKQVAW